MLGRILVGYSTSIRKDAAGRLPGKVREDEKQKQLAFQKRLRTRYWGQLELVFLCDPLHDRMASFKRGTAKPIASLIKEWLLRPQAYSHELFEGNCPWRFIGFDPREFVKLLGSECGEAEDPLEDTCWVGVTNYWDIGNCAVGSEEGKVGASLGDPLQLYGIQKHHNLSLPYIPHQDPEQDLYVTTELATRLGMLVRVAEAAEEAEDDEYEEDEEDDGLEEESEEEAEDEDDED